MTGWAAVLEANLTDYAGMYLARQEAKGAHADDSPLAAAGRTEAGGPRHLPHESPWRVVLFADACRAADRVGPAAAS